MEKWVKDVVTRLNAHLDAKRSKKTLREAGDGTKCERPLCNDAEKHSIMHCHFNKRGDIAHNSELRKYQHCLDLIGLSQERFNFLNTNLKSRSKQYKAQPAQFTASGPSARLLAQQSNSNADLMDVWQARRESLPGREKVRGRRLELSQRSLAGPIRAADYLARKDL